MNVIKKEAKIATIEHIHEMSQSVKIRELTPVARKKSG